jgi:DNA-binding LacI/PurR family transcriptional regulator
MSNALYKKLRDIKASCQDTGVPLYEQLRKSLEDMIVSGELPDNHRLPPDKEFAANIGVNHITLAKALNALRKQGLIGRSRSFGTYVKAPAEDLEHLPGEQHRLIAVIFDDVNPTTFQSDLFISLHEKLQAHGLEMLFLSSSGRDDIQYEQIKGMLQKPNCCGCLVWSVMKKNQVRELMEMKPSDFPLVFMDKRYDGVGHDCAVYDNFGSAIELCKPFIKRNFEKFVFLVREHVFNYSSIQDRYQGIRETLDQNSIDPDNAIVFPYSSEDEINISTLTKQCKDAVLIAAHAAEVEELQKTLKSEGKDLSHFYPFAAFGPSLAEEHFRDITEFKLSATSMAENAVNILVSRLNGDRSRWKELKSGGKLYERASSSIDNESLAGAT